MTRLITVGIVIVVLWIGWIVFQKWESVSAEQEMTQTEYERAHAMPAAFDPRSLSGVPQQMEESLQKAKENGAKGLAQWLDLHRKYVQDPRLAWVELDYAVLLAPENPVEAKKIYGDVKDRIPPTSVIYPRIKQLEKTFE
jgi:hypothetical protein